MHRRLMAASLTLGLAYFASQGSAQVIDFHGNHQAQGPSVRQASCNCGTGGVHLAGGGQIIAAGGAGSCGVGPCGPGGCPTGDCVGECNFAPYGHCLYPNPCWGACKGPCCRTIVGEMLLDVRRWYSNRRRFGSLAGNAIGACDNGANGVFCEDGGCSDVGCGAGCCSDIGCSDAGCGDVGCSDAGCTGGGLFGAGVCNKRGIIDGPLLSGGLLRGGLLERFRRGRLESDCGCESVEDCSADACSAPLEVTCGCEDTVYGECGGGCAGDADICFQDILSPRPSRGLMSRLGEILFGSKCNCGSCSGSCFEADCGVEEVSCGVEEISCGVEAAGCAAVTRRSVRTEVAGQGRQAIGRSLASRKVRQVSPPAARPTTELRQEKLASQELQVPAVNEDSGVVRRVRFDEQVVPKTVLRFRD